jgi:hypothetical protein
MSNSNSSDILAHDKSIQAQPAVIGQQQPPSTAQQPSPAATIQQPIVQPSVANQQPIVQPSVANQQSQTNSEDVISRLWQNFASITNAVCKYRFLVQEYDYLYLNCLNTQKKKKKAIMDR